MSDALLLRGLLERNATFAAFRVSGEAPKLWVQRTGPPPMVEAATLDREQQAFVIAPFLGQLGHVHLIRADEELLLDGAATLDLSTIPPGETYALRSATEADRSQYMSGVERIKAAIAAGPRHIYRRRLQSRS